MEIPQLNAANGTFKHFYEVFSHDPKPKLLYRVNHLNSIEEIDEICTKSREGFEQWREMSVFKRIEILKKASVILASKEAEFIELFKEIGLPEWFSQFNSELLVTHLEEYISQMTNSEGEVLRVNMADFAYTINEPIGPVLAIAPWNAPGVLTGRTLCAPLAAGCSVILKTSELAARVGYLWVKCLLEAGVPGNVVQLVHVRAEDNKEFVERIINHKCVKKISFTGSTKTGRQIAMTAAASLKPCVLELGGKNCSIIGEDADLDKAVGASLWGSWSHKGQICMSTDKIFIHASLYEQFIDTVKTIAPKLLEDKDYFIPQRNLNFARTVNDLIEDALDKGAEIIFGEKTDMQGQNISMHPLVLTGITKDMKIHSQEIFGPVVCVYKFNNIKDTIMELNNEPYGLKASIWSSNIIKAQKWARLVECGGVHVNSPTIYDECTVPHGGVKDSGSGRFNSKWGIQEFSYVKAITLSE